MVTYNMTEMNYKHFLMQIIMIIALLTVKMQILAHLTM